jgi:putative addiction module antidote
VQSFEKQTKTGGIAGVITNVIIHEGVTNMTTVKLTTVGSSTGIVLPKEVLERLRVSKGDVLHLVETPHGVELTPYDPEFEKQMAVAEQVMRSDRNVLKKLAE